MKNYSKQREVVMNVLQNTKSHPTVNWIYEQARLQIPNISLGTVYRNLTELNREGMIAEIPVSDGCQHFDADISNHIHFHCLSCGAIYDCPAVNDSLNDYIEKTLDCSVRSEKRLFEGICRECLSLNKN